MADRLTIVGLYNSFRDAEDAVGALVNNGYPRESMNIVANDTSGDFEQYIDTVRVRKIDNADDVDGSDGAAFGAIVGTLTGLGVAIIPGIGPVLAVGPWAAALVAGIGAASGAVTGGVVASLIDLGIDEGNANAYAETVRRGGVLVIVHTTDESAGDVESLLNNYNPIDVDEREAVYRGEGWQKLDASAAPYEREDIDNFRKRYNELAPASDMVGSMQARRYVGNTVYEPFEMYEPYYKEHHAANLPATNHDYSDYRSAYFYGYNLATHPAYHNLEWASLEPEARRFWFERDDHTAWENIKDVVKEGWQRVQNTVKS